MLKMGMKRARFAALLVTATMFFAGPTLAQSAAPESPGTALSRNIRVLASNPRDFNALVGAGRAALELGDVQAAAGFFGRAEEVNPNAPAAKAGLGASMAHMGDADGAIYYFDQASRLGASQLAIALDRGLARDLLGNLRAAQSDYRLAIASLGSDEARRRLALSLAIGRDRAGALAAIQPLLNRRDPAAQRARAFVLALVGDQIGAAQAIESAMPGRIRAICAILPLSAQSDGRREGRGGSSGDFSGQCRCAYCPSPAAADWPGQYSKNCAGRTSSCRNLAAPWESANSRPGVGEDRLDDARP